jgi:hypothetical protein
MTARPVPDTTRLMESTPILRRVGLVAVNLVVFVAAFAVTRGMIDRAAGWEPDGEVAIKLAHLEEHGDDYEVIFIGSSRTFRGVDPGAFDARMAELGIELRSFNLGIQGMFAYELEAVLDRVVAMDLTSLRLILVAPDVFQADLETEITSSPRVVAWHDPAETAAALRRALDQPRTRPNKDVVVTLDVLAPDVEVRRAGRRSVVNEIENGFASGRFVRLVGEHDAAHRIEVAAGRLIGAPEERIEPILAEARSDLEQGRWVDLSARFSADLLEDPDAVADVVAALEGIAADLADVGLGIGAPFREAGNLLVLRIAPDGVSEALEWAQGAALDANGTVEIPVTAADGTILAVAAPPNVRNGVSGVGERALWAYNHLNAFLINSMNQGRLLDALLGDSPGGGAGSPEGELDPAAVLGPAGDGFVPYDVAERTDAIGSGTEFRRRQFLEGEPIRLFTRSRLEPTAQEVDYGIRVAELIEGAGAVAVLAALPGDASSPWVAALEAEEATLDFNRFPEYAELFDRSLWYDRGHLDSRGAALFSSRLAEALYPLLSGGA